jgi:hypothetical protein
MKGPTGMQLNEGRRHFMPMRVKRQAAPLSGCEMLSGYK